MRRPPGSARTSLGSLQRSPDPLAGLRGRVGMNKEGEEKGWEKEWRGERGEEGRRGGAPASLLDPPVPCEIIKLPGS